MPEVNETLNERGARYGDFTDHAELAQEIQRVMQGSRKSGPNGEVVHPWPKLDSVKRQALTVIADKIARILSGDPNYTDNWHDIQGYAKLAEDRCVDSTLPQLAFPNKHDPLAGQHLTARQSDEYFCSKCGKRWGVDENAPERCA
jgi:hypothetical protein